MQIKEQLEPLIMAEASGLAYMREAMEKEYMSLVYNNTWKLVLLPPNKMVVSDKWCYQEKTDAGGMVQQHKAKYVA